MGVAVETARPRLELAEQVPQHFDVDLIVSPDDNPAPKPAVLETLLASIGEHGQLVPAWVCPSPDLPEHKRLCIEGNHRLAVCRTLGRPFWAFDLGRFVPEAERIQLTFQHNHSRRRMPAGEVAGGAIRWMELTGCNQAEASARLNISPATLSRVLGDRRIPPELRPKADLLAQSIRSLISAVPSDLMGKAFDFALAAGPDDKRPTRDAVALYIRQLKKNGQGEGRKPKPVSLRVGGRLVTLSLTKGDSATTVAEDLKAIVARLGKHAEVPPDGWPFLFQ
jgi:ParB-like nuclease domain